MEMEIEEVVGMAKEVCLKQKGEHIPQFMIQDREGNWSLVAAPFNKEDKEMAIGALKMMVNKMGSKRYFVIFGAWMLNTEKHEKITKKKIKEALSNGMEDPEGLMVRLQDIRDRYGGSPAENEASDEILMISEFKKGKESLSIVIPIVREGDKVSFGDEQSLHTMGSGGNISTIWNIWTPVEINLDEKLEEMKRKRGKKKSKK